MTDADAVLAANLEFYRAFATRDIAAMEAIWARHAPVGCVHPGWPALAERDAIIESWRGILANPQAPRIACYDERVLLYGDTALVLCEEELDGGTLVASNLFVREDGAWRIAHHQAGQLVARRQTRPAPRPPAARPRGSIEPVAQPYCFGGLRRLDREPHVAQPEARLEVEQPVPALRAKAALERGERDLLGAARHAIADAGEIGEGGGAVNDADAAPAPPRDVRRRGRPQPDPGARQTLPVEQLAGVGSCGRARCRNGRRSGRAGCAGAR